MKNVSKIINLYLDSETSQYLDPPFEVETRLRELDVLSDRRGSIFIAVATKEERRIFRQIDINITHTTRVHAYYVNEEGIFNVSTHAAYVTVFQTYEQASRQHQRGLEAARDMLEDYEEETAEASCVE